MTHPSKTYSDIVVVTDFSSPYQVELFDQIEKCWPGRIEVYYRTRSCSVRGWSQPPLQHRHFVLDRDPRAIGIAQARFRAARLAIFNHYTDRQALDLLNSRAKSGRPWVFWGERPGYISPRLGRFYRMWVLRALHRSWAPIWGIGKMAVDRYRAEFGPRRQYVVLPYFSDLKRFAVARDAVRPESDGRRVVLYSGSLILRKGVDLLARAFARLALDQSASNLSLRIVGRGERESAMRRVLATCADRVEFVGFKDWADLPAEYGRAHVLCAPSRYDGWGLIVPEGLAAGLPVISTNRTGAAVELIENAKNGWLIDAEKEDSLFAALKDASRLGQKELAAMSTNASLSVAEHSLEEGARRFMKASEEAIDNWRSQTATGAIQCAE